MLPLLAVHFHRVSPASLLLNLWVGFFLAVESFAALFGVLFVSVSRDLAAPFIASAELANRLMMSLPTLLSTHELAGFRVPIYSGPARWIYVAYAVSVVGAGAALFMWEPFRLVRVRRWARVFISTSLLSGMLGALILAHPYSAPRADGKLKIDFLDVGQGDSALVTFPNGVTMLVDGGGRPNFRSDDEAAFLPDTPRIGEFVVSEFLWEKGYASIDYIVGTHADADHMQGLVDVVENFKVGTIIVSREEHGDDDFERLASVARRRSIPISVLSGDAISEIGGARVEILGSDQISAATANNASVVMKLIYGARSVLLTGDIERGREAELISFRGDELQADVIKVAHHGSRTSSSENFIRSVGAKLAVISVGRRSPFGHPHHEVVNRWRDSGADVIATGESGTITVSTDGSALEVRTFAGVPK
jgi:competence protein ComEC